MLTKLSPFVWTRNDETELLPPFTAKRQRLLGPRMREFEEPSPSRFAERRGRLPPDAILNTCAVGAGPDPSCGLPALRSPVGKKPIRLRSPFSERSYIAISFPRTGFVELVHNKHRATRIIIGIRRASDNQGADRQHGYGQRSHGTSIHDHLLGSIVWEIRFAGPHPVRCRGPLPQCAARPDAPSSGY